MTNDSEIAQARDNMAKLRAQGYAIGAWFDSRERTIVVELNNGRQVRFPTNMIEGLSDATAESLGKIEISPSGLGLHWPLLDADLYLPALMDGILD